MANNKYNQLKRQYSLDGGLTWHDLLPMVYKVGNVIETNSDCVDESGCRWVILPISEAYDCDSNYNLYQIEAEECLQPNGTFKRTGNIRRYQLVDTYSVLCGYTGITCTPSVRTEYSYGVVYNGGAVEWDQVATPVVSQIKTVITRDKGCVETSSSTSTNITNYSISYNPSGDNTNEEDRNVIATVTYNDRVIGSFTYVQKGYVHVNEPTLVGNLIYKSDEDLTQIYSSNKFTYSIRCKTGYEGAYPSSYSYPFTNIKIEDGYLNEANDFNLNYPCDLNSITSITGFHQYAVELKSFPDTKNIYTFKGLFTSMDKITSLDLSNFNTSNVIDMSEMFKYSKKLVSLNLSGWNTNNLESISYMFSGCTNLTYLDVSGWELTDNLTDYDYVFAHCDNLRTVIMNDSSCKSINRMRAILLFNKMYDVDLITNVTNCNINTECSSEENCNNTLVIIPSSGSKYDETLDSYVPTFRGIKQVYLNETSFDVDETFEPYDLYNAVYSIDITTLNGAYPLTSCDRFLEYTGEVTVGRILCFPDVSNVTSMNRMFANPDGSYLGEANTGLQCVNAKGWNTSNVTDMHKMFWICAKLEEIIGIEDWDVSNVTDMTGMFHDCHSLKSLDLSKWDMSNVTDIYDSGTGNGMFDGCYSLEYLKLPLNMPKVTNMSGMFGTCDSLTSIVNIENLNVSNVTNMHGMFSGCDGLTSLDLSNWDVSNVTNMNGMFSSCDSLTSLDLSNWDTSNLTTMRDMFAYSSGLTSIDNIENLNVSNVTNMNGVFFQCDSLTSLDLSNWDVSNVSDFVTIFGECDNLTTLNISGWDLSKTHRNYYLFGSGLTTIYCYGCNQETIDILIYEKPSNCTLVY